MNKIFRVIWSHAQQAWVVVSELVKSHTKTSTYTDKRAQLCTSHYFLDKQQDKFKLSFLSLVLLSIFFSPVGSAAWLVYGSTSGDRGSDDGSIGIGPGSRVGSDSIAIGRLSKSQNMNSVAIGLGANAQSYESIALGKGAHTTANYAVALGSNAGASGEHSVAIGTYAQAVGNNSISIGNGANARLDSISLGREANATHTQTVAIGPKASASGAQSVAIGGDTKAQGRGSISIGNDDLDETQYQDVDGFSRYVGTRAQGHAAIAIGGKSIADGNGSVVVGPVSKATHIEGVAIGAKSTSNGDYGVAVGGSSVAGSRSASLGYKAAAGGISSVAVGEQATTNQAKRATALGNNSIVTVDGGVALGYGSRAEMAGGVEGARQSYSITTEESSVINGLKSTQNVDNNIPIGAVSVGNDKIKRQITNVAAGTKLTDAVNVAQLKSLTMKIGGDSNAGEQPKVGLWEGILNVKGTSGEIKTSASGNTITLKLDETLKQKITDSASKEYVNTKFNEISTVTTHQYFTVGDGGTNTTKITVNTEKDKKHFDIKGKDGVTTTVVERAVEVGLTTEITNKINKIDGLETKVNNQGITFVADAGTQNNTKTDPVKLGSELKIAGGTNIGTTVSDNKDAININLDDDVVLSATGSVAFGNDTTLLTKLENNGLTVKTDTTTNAKTIEVTKTGIKAGDKKITNVAAGDVKDNSTDAINGNQLHNFIKVGDKAVAKDGVVKFANGTGTTVSAENGEIKVNVNTGTSTVDEDGKAKSTSTDHDNKIATVKDITDTVNKTFWKASTDKEGTGKQATGSENKLAKVKAGDEVKFKAGDNLIIKQDGIEDRDFTYSLNKDVDLKDGSVKFNKAGETATSVQLDENGLTITKPANSGDTKSDVKLTASGLDNGGNTIKNVAKPVNETDAANKKYVDDTNTIVEAGTGITVSDPQKQANGANKYTVSVNTGAFGATTNDGKLSQQTAGVATVENVVNAVNAGYWKAKSGSKTSNIKFGDTLEFVDGSVTTASLTDDGKVSYDVKYDNNTITKTVDGKLQVNTAVMPKTTFKVKANEETQTENVTDGDTLTFKSGKNIAVSRSGKEFTIATSDTPTFTYVTIARAPTKGNQAANKNYVDGLRTTVQSSDNSISVEDKDNSDKYAYDIKVNYTKVAENAKLSYKANNTGTQEVALSTGLNFTNTDNITASVADNGVVKHTLNSELKGVTSITDKTDGTGTKITLSTADNDKKVTLNDAKLTGLTAGDITDTSKDAVTGKQLKDLADKIGVGLETSSTTAFKTPEFTKLKETKGTDVTAKEAKTVFAALEETRNKVNEGLKFKGEEADGTKTITKQLGETLQFVSNDFTLTTTSNNTTTSSTAYKGENLAVVSNGSEIVVGMKDALTNIKSIANGDENTGTKITLASDKKELNVNSAKVTGLADGKVSNDSTDATTGKQLYNLVKVNGTNAVNDIENNPNKGGINFADSSTVTIVKGTNGNVTMAVSNTTLSVADSGDNIGKVTAPNTDADKAKFVNANDLSDTLNKMGFNVESGGNLATGNADGKQLIKAGDTVKFEAGNGLLVKRVGGTFTYELGDSLKTNNLNVGEKGEKGKDGTISVNGKDGSAVVINGKDGSIGLNGKDGANGVTIKGDQGPAGVDGGKKTRIVYEYKDPNKPGTTIKEEIATLKDGQKYSGDNYKAAEGDKAEENVIAKKLNERLEIKGGADTTKLSDNNIGVIAENGVLNVKLAKNIDLGTDGSVTMGNTTMNDSGITIKKPTNAGDKKSDVKLTASGLDNGGNVISNVAEGKKDTDAVNVKQLKDTVNAAATDVVSNDGSIDVMGEVDAVTGKNTYDLSVKTSAITVKAGNQEAASDGNNGYVKADDVVNAINKTTKAARTEVTDGRNTQVVATTGENGQDIYNVSVSGLPMEYATEDGKSIINMGGNFYLEEPAADGSIKLIPVVNAKGKFSTKTQNPDGSVTLKPLAVKVNLANEAPMVLGNVAKGVADTDAVNVKQLKLTRTEVEAGKNVKVTSKTGANGQNIYKVSVSGDLSDITSISNGDTKVSLGKDEQGNPVVNM
ncbi:ESPR-type extended signal peptide-containing protein, partial [Glaesserella parasuis]|nr:ESPR-type extended signal peptide-containing protein [Glaesserella parasuis]MDO9841285.1 ESPR-type extended signal peptide-containing protein [Glaesserella parasuis]MDP0183068.1 ESPR-type extended signal peptide-containing protein [Glaesserella parasuis]MDP0193585.1 ESPR-type extended signal peptide-containing protein [Glaesserella parasuis]MDP0338408.1 ESPR-type extended signal peptide-containing protein [Glaesserella parasuis]